MKIVCILWCERSSTSLTIRHLSQQISTYIGEFTIHKLIPENYNVMYDITAV